MSRRRAGLSLLEAVFAVGILVGTFVALLSTLAGGVAANGELERTAWMAASSKLEELRGLQPAQIWERYRVGGTTGPSFDVPGLPSGGRGAGTITLHLDETVVDDALNLPRDLDGDGLASVTDVSSSAVLLPVTIRVSWTSRGGEREVGLSTLIGERQ